MCKPNCNPNNCPLAGEGILIEEVFVEVPVSRYEELIRAETERNVLEAAIGCLASYDVKDVMTAIKAAREKGHAGEQTSPNEEVPDGSDAGE